MHKYARKIMYNQPKDKLFYFLYCLFISVHLKKLYIFIDCDARSDGQQWDWVRNKLISPSHVYDGSPQVLVTMTSPLIIFEKWNIKMLSSSMLQIYLKLLRWFLFSRSRNISAGVISQSSYFSLFCTFGISFFTKEVIFKSRFVS